MGSTSSFTKTICSICYEDLKPITEDLQSISVCGHVFHELCLQQWFEYCPKGKKRNCPVCKQTCTNANVSRLYFQSVGDSNDTQQRTRENDNEEFPEELREEINRLEGKANALTLTVEQQHKQLKELQDQLLASEGKLKDVALLKNEILTQKETIQQLLRVKSEALDKLTLECMRVRERNMALAKELAALKLASDLNLDDKEIMKLASLGNDSGSKETVDVLRKSLVIRNKSYKELMAKCHTLGRGEAQCLRKLEKANKKIEKLRLRVQELETTIELNDNGALRVLKDQDCKFETSSYQNMMEGSADQANSDKAADLAESSFCMKKLEPFKPIIRKSTMDDFKSASTYKQNDQENLSLVNEKESILRPSAQGHGLSYETSTYFTDNSAIKSTSHAPMQTASFDAQNKSDRQRHSINNEASCSTGVEKVRKSDKPNEPPIDMDDDVICYGQTNQAQASVHTGKEGGLSVPAVQPGGHCFSGGLLGPDGTNWHLGKWCKKSQNSGSSVSAGLQGSNVRSGDLIAVGADGRGGRIKVMRSLDRSSDITETRTQAKRNKNGVKAYSLQSQGSLQIEHFFQRKRQ